MEQAFIVCKGYDEILYPMIFTNIDNAHKKANEYKKQGINAVVRVLNVQGGTW